MPFWSWFLPRQGTVEALFEFGDEFVTAQWSACAFVPLKYLGIELGYMVRVGLGCLGKGIGVYQSAFLSVLDFMGAGPEPVIRCVDESGSDRIFRDMAKGVVEMGGRKGKRGVAALPEVSPPIFAGIDVLGVSSVYFREAFVSDVSSEGMAMRWRWFGMRQ
jgi:hypothetical protein